jgi:hypothetical protein
MSPMAGMVLTSLVCAATFTLLLLAELGED